MTAEIGILNKSGVALAADSAVTLGTPNGPKIYNTANKLFTLSKYAPIGAMVYGNASLMEVPWETIIKYYRANLGKRKFATLEEYAQHFLGFLSTNKQLFPEYQQKNYFSKIVYTKLMYIAEQIKKQVKITINNKGKINNEEIIGILNEVIESHYGKWDNKPYEESVTENFSLKLMKDFADIINEEIKKVFQKLPLERRIQEMLNKIAVWIFCKKGPCPFYSGIVIAGFGESEIFPSILSFLCKGVFEKRLIYTRDRDKCAYISFDNTAAIIPFAQSEMVITFMEGIHPDCWESLRGYLEELFRGYPECIIEALDQLTNGFTEKEKISFEKSLYRQGKQLLTDLLNQFKAYRNEFHVNPILQAVEVLPKDELASMAESLVNITSLKRKVSIDNETVGGPIDVAVITKGEGFIWIKRKHYFDSKLNHHFFANYYKEGEL